MSEDKKPKSDAAESIANEAMKNTLALNPLVGLQPEDMYKAAGTVMKAMATQPAVVAKKWMELSGEMGKIMTGQSELTPDRKDRRFADPAWLENPLYKGLMQSYMAWGQAVTETVEETKLDEKDQARARLVTSIFVDTLSPANMLATNPAAVKKAMETKGKSLVDGMKNFYEDMTKNGGLPSSVDTSKFTVGDNLANTPGHVVFRNDVLEVIHYTATTDKVYRRPLLVVPPQINKYYSIDMAPNKSMIRFLLSQGIQPYCVSWRNPTKEHRDWDMDTYVMALDEAVDVILKITGADSLNIQGACSGGITLASYLGWLAGTEQDDKIHSLIMAVCVLDTMSTQDNDFASLVTPETVMAAKKASQLTGTLDGQEMAKMFAWMRPNDLIWNYWINNYLLGNQPPAFDVLFWNADTTRLPAGLHGDFLDLIFTNPFMNAGKMSVLGVPIDMEKVNLPAYVIAGTTDHITPWKGVYKTARIFGDDTQFILSNSGHLQSLLNPPGNPKAWYVKAPAKADDPDAWAETAEKKEGSWWLDWAVHLKANGGNEINAPKKPGHKDYPSLGPAPGTYVFEP